MFDYLRRLFRRLFTDHKAQVNHRLDVLTGHDTSC